MKKGIRVIVLCAVFVFGITLGAIGAANQEEVKAIINYELKIKLNGQDFTPTRADGMVMRPLLYNDSTYLPVRAIAEALSIAVDYDAATQTVYLGEKGRTPLEGIHFDHLWSCQLTFDQSQLFVNGKQYQSGILYTGTDGYKEMGGFVLPKGQFQKFGGVACLQDDDNTTDEVTIKIREKDQSGKVLKELKVKNGESIAFEIDIPNMQQLYIQNLIYERVPKNTQPDIMVIADPYFK
ncbi:MAG: stalk domain-containing protein [Desulfotomaculaceae bacterium]|nr:stalk domain-containing protein [Desulfotomaculaceae bacterium]